MMTSMGGCNRNEMVDSDRESWTVKSSTVDQQKIKDNNKILLEKSDFITKMTLEKFKHYSDVDTLCIYQMKRQLVESVIEEQYAKFDEADDNDDGDKFSSPPLIGEVGKDCEPSDGDADVSSFGETKKDERMDSDSNGFIDVEESEDGGDKSCMCSDVSAASDDSSHLKRALEDSSDWSRPDGGLSGNVSAKQQATKTATWSVNDIMSDTVRKDSPESERRAEAVKESVRPKKSEPVETTAREAEASGRRDDVTSKSDRQNDDCAQRSPVGDRRRSPVPRRSKTRRKPQAPVYCRQRDSPEFDATALYHTDQNGGSGASIMGRPTFFSQTMPSIDWMLPHHKMADVRQPISVPYQIPFQLTPTHAQQADCVGPMFPLQRGPAPLTAPYQYSPTQFLQMQQMNGPVPQFEAYQAALMSEKLASAQKVDSGLPRGCRHPFASRHFDAAYEQCDPNTLAYCQTWCNVDPNKPVDNAMGQIFENRLPFNVEQNCFASAKDLDVRLLPPSVEQNLNYSRLRSVPNGHHGAKAEIGSHQFSIFGSRGNKIRSFGRSQDNRKKVGSTAEKRPMTSSALDVSNLLPSEGQRAPRGQSSPQNEIFSPVAMALGDSWSSPDSERLHRPQTTIESESRCEIVIPEDSGPSGSSELDAASTDDQTELVPTPVPRERYVPRFFQSLPRESVEKLCDGNMEDMAAVIFPRPTESRRNDINVETTDEGNSEKTETEIKDDGKQTNTTAHDEEATKVKDDRPSFVDVMRKFISSLLDRGALDLSKATASSSKLIHDKLNNIPIVCTCSARRRVNPSRSSLRAGVIEPLPTRAPPGTPTPPPTQVHPERCQNAPVFPEMMNTTPRDRRTTISQMDQSMNQIGFEKSPKRVHNRGPGTMFDGTGVRRMPSAAAGRPSDLDCERFNNFSANVNVKHKDAFQQLQQQQQQQQQNRFFLEKTREFSFAPQIPAEAATPAFYGLFEPNKLMENYQALLHGAPQNFSVPPFAVNPFIMTSTVVPPAKRPRLFTDDSPLDVASALCSV